jgi:hypothetical protein
MSEERHKGNWRHSVWVSLCVLLALYVGGYFVLGEHETHLGRPVWNVRIYRPRMVAYAYAPLAWIEAKTRRHQVHVKTSDGDWTTFDP